MIVYLVRNFMKTWSLILISQCFNRHQKHGKCLKVTKRVRFRDNVSFLDYLDALLGKSTVKKEDIEQKSLELLLTFFTNDQNVEVNLFWYLIIQLQCCNI